MKTASIVLAVLAVVAVLVSLNSGALEKALNCIAFLLFFSGITAGVIEVYRIYSKSVTLSTVEKITCIMVIWVCSSAMFYLFLKALKFISYSI